MRHDDFLRQQENLFNKVRKAAAVAAGKSEGGERLILIIRWALENGYQVRLLCEDESHIYQTVIKGSGEETWIEDVKRVSRAVLETASYELHLGIANRYHRDDDLDFELDFRM